MPGSPVHLIRRFVDVLTATPLKAEEASAVRAWASESECSLFFAQSTPDQRHAYESALVVVSGGSKEIRVIRAALMHDIGKRHSNLGAVGRTVASLLVILRLWLPARVRAYRDHGLLGSEELKRIGSDPLVVDFARFHQGSRPQTIDPATWGVLVRADEPPKAMAALRRRITWPLT